MAIYGGLIGRILQALSGLAGLEGALPAYQGYASRTAAHVQEVVDGFDEGAHNLLATLAKAGYAPCKPKHPVVQLLGQKENATVVQKGRFNAASRADEIAEGWLVPATQYISTYASSSQTA